MIKFGDKSYADSWPVSSVWLERRANNANVMGSSPILANCYSVLRLCNECSCFIPH